MDLPKTTKDNVQLFIHEVRRLQVGRGQHWKVGGRGGGGGGGYELGVALGGPEGGSGWEGSNLEVGAGGAWGWAGWGCTGESFRCS